MPRPFDSQTHLPSAGGHDYDDDEYLEKQPLNVGQSFTGGFYPPQYVSFKYICVVLFSVVPLGPLTPITLANIHSIDLALSFLRLPMVLRMRGDDDKPSDAARPVRLSSPTEISLQSILSQHLSFLPWRKSGLRRIPPNFRENLLVACAGATLTKLQQ